PDVVVVAVHVDELVQIAGLGDELALEARIAGHQTVEELTHGRPLDGDRRDPADMRAQDGGQADFDRHHGEPPWPPVYKFPTIRSAFQNDRGLLDVPVGDPE